MPTRYFPTKPDPGSFGDETRPVGVQSCKNNRPFHKVLFRIKNQSKHRDRCETLALVRGWVLNWQCFDHGDPAHLDVLKVAHPDIPILCSLPHVPYKNTGVKKFRTRFEPKFPFHILTRRSLQVAGGFHSSTRPLPFDTSLILFSRKPRSVASRTSLQFSRFVKLRFAVVRVVH